MQGAINYAGEVVAAGLGGGGTGCDHTWVAGGVGVTPGLT